VIATMQTSILIVEDDLGIAELEKDRLEEAGHRTFLAADTDEAIGLVRENDIDLILLDYRLPGNEDGLQFFQRIREAGYEIPVILVTGFSNEATVIRALRAGVRDFVTKSLEYLEYLPEAVGRVLHQVQTEHKLADSEARLANIIRSARDAIIVTDGEQRVTLFNPAAEAMFHCPIHEALGKRLACFIPSESHHHLAKDAHGVPHALHHSAPGTRGVRTDGSSFPIEASMSRGEAGGRQFYAVVVRDITERRRSEQRIREQAALLDQASDAIEVHDLKHKISYWNRGAEALYGWTAEEAIGRNALTMFGRNAVDDLQQVQQKVLETGSWTGELRQVTKDGREILVHSRQTLLRNDDGSPKAQLTINTDITEKRKLEQQLLHSKRMESIGLLASGVAHDFNNLLTVICGYSELLIGQSPPESEAHLFLGEIQKAGERASSLTRQLLAFGRKQILSPQILSINDLVVDLERMLRRLIGADVDLGKSLDPSLGQVRADPTQIEQVILNLVVNARDAMPSGGKITIETRNVELHESYAHQHVDLKAGWYVMLAVTDTGCGMDEATKARIFEPFFTTKEVGKGTGLGLATVHGIIKQSGGHIEVYSEPGHGSSFKVYLPLVNAGEMTAAPTVAPIVARGTETVLIVEDDEHVRRLAQISLVSSGYRVLEATDGEKALQIAKDHSDPIDILVTDLVMPRMNGRELAERISLERPSLKILFTSGYTDDAVVRHGILQEGVAFLQKPFAPGTLAQKVRDVLDQAKSRN
jgi:two-component system cell cycle sensor histidine kinase/response regulator CckA